MTEIITRKVPLLGTVATFESALGSLTSKTLKQNFFVFLINIFGYFLFLWIISADHYENKKKMNR